MGADRYPLLFSEGRLGELRLRNRIVAAATGSNLAERDGRVSEALLRQYEGRARGGAGLVVVEVAAVDFPRGAAMPRQLGISEDRFLPGLEQLAGAIRAQGAAASIQLQHAGKVAVRDLHEGRPLSAPSAGPAAAASMLQDLTAAETAKITEPILRAGGPGPSRLVHELSVEEIAALVERFAAAAERAARAGFDAVEIHGAHGYLLAEFLSPASNRRDDAYGGSLAGRARFLLEVVRAVRERVGDRLALVCRLDGAELHEPRGIRIEQACEVAQWLEREGIDAIHVSAYGGPGGIGFTQAPLVHEPAGLLPLAAEVKRAVRVPVIAVGRLEPERAEQALREGAADFVALARALLADPELPLKLASGRRRGIRPCIYCYTCVGRIFVNEPLRCAVNPAVGRPEADRPLAPASRARRVLVVGGGPAGLEAARLAAARGHSVTLWEREAGLGGALRAAAVVWPENEALLDYLLDEATRAPIRIELGREATPEAVAELAPEVVLVATGARIEPPSIPGLSLPHVWSPAALRGLAGAGGGAGDAATAGGARVPTFLALASRLGRRWLRPRHLRALSRLRLPLGRRVVVLGGDLVGLELALFLAERGREVVVVERAPDLGAELAIPRRWRILHELRVRGVALRPATEAEAVEPQAVRVRDAHGKRARLAADSVVVAEGARPDPSLAAALQAPGREVHCLGDAREVGLIAGALSDAARIAAAI